MAVRSAEAEWNLGLREGKGTVKLGSGAFQGPYSFVSRFEDGPGTNPEELIAAAHAGCFSMALSGILGSNGYQPQRIRTSARVTIEKANGGFQITRSELSTQADVPGIDEETFRNLAHQAKEGCPVSKALAGVQISLDARLLDTKHA